MMKFWNSRLKFKFFDINWVWFIPHMLKSGKTSQFQGTFGILESWIPGSRNPCITPKVCKINTNILCRRVFLKPNHKPSITHFLEKKTIFYKLFALFYVIHLFLGSCQNIPSPGHVMPLWDHSNTKKFCI